MSELAWPHVQEWIRAAEVPVTVLPPNLERRDVLFKEVGVSLASALGAVVFETGGILVDNGWLRILGAGHEQLPRSARPDRNWVVVADDAVGGFFALLPPEGDVGYLAPDTLRWESLGMKYSAWLRWCLTAAIAKFYQDYRAANWRESLQKLRHDQCYQILPPPWSEGPPYTERTWCPVPVHEMYLMTLDFQTQLGGDA